MPTKRSPRARRETPRRARTASPQKCACPLCGTQLSRNRWEEVTKVAEAKEQALASERQELERAHKRLDAERTKIEATAKKRTEQAVAKERAAAKKRADAALTKERAAAKKRTDAVVASERAKRDKALAAAKATARAVARKEVAAEQAQAIKESKGALKALQTEQAKERSRHNRENTQLKNQVAKLQRKVDARDGAGHFGPEGETDLFSALTRAFPRDVIEQKGRGGDVIHRVMDRGVEVGVIVFEVKNTGTWLSKHTRQLRADMERHGTRYGVLVARTLPARESGLCIQDGLIVVTPPLARYVAAVLRRSIVRLAALKRAGKDQAGKSQRLVAYLSGDDFRTAVTAVATRIETLRKELDSEKATHQRMWRDRAEHYAEIALRNAGIDEQVGALLEDDLASDGANDGHPVRLVG